VSERIPSDVGWTSDDHLQLVIAQCKKISNYDTFATVTFSKMLHYSY
jgi:hypothetical protein